MNNTGHIKRLDNYNLSCTCILCILFIRFKKKINKILKTLSKLKITYILVQYVNLLKIKYVNSLLTSRLSVYFLSAAMRFYRLKKMEAKHYYFVVFWAAYVPWMLYLFTG